MHEVGADQPCEGERPFGEAVGLTGEAQQQVGDQGHRDLDADSVLARADEVLDLQGLFDPTEEQLDGPAPLVQVGDLAGRRLRIVGENTQHLAVFVLHLHLAHLDRQRVPAAPGHALGQATDQVEQDVGAVAWDGSGLVDVELGVGLQAGDEAAVQAVERRPPGEVVVAHVEDVGDALLDRDVLGRLDVVLEGVTSK